MGIGSELYYHIIAMFWIVVGSKPYERRKLLDLLRFHLFLRNFTDVFANVFRSQFSNFYLRHICP